MATRAGVEISVDPSPSYDALNRLTQQDGTSYGYNGDGVLVTAGSTTYAQDLAAPLSQVLSDGSTSYLYGHQRLAALGQAWYVGDALGSVRQTLDGSGAVLAATGYSPWGTPQQPLPTPFGFTGELHGQDRIHLRTRWYDPGNGTFTARDPFGGIPDIPNTLHPYSYGANNPVVMLDPSGRCYGALEGLRNLPLEDEWCRNLDKAVLIYTSEHSPWDAKAWAYSYAAAWYVGHGVAVASVAAAGAAGAGWVFSQGAAWLAAHPTAAAVVGGGSAAGAAAATVVDDAVLLTAALTGDPYSANEIHTAQQLAASDGGVFFGDVLAACGLVIPRVGSAGSNFISLGRRYTDYRSWWRDGRVRAWWGGCRYWHLRVVPRLFCGGC